MSHDDAFVTKAIGNSICSAVKPLLRTPANLPKVRRPYGSIVRAPESRLVPVAGSILAGRCHSG